MFKCKPSEMSRSLFLYGWLVLPVLVFWSVSDAGAASSSVPGPVIMQRLDNARQLQAIRQAALRPMEKDILLLANFETANAVFLGDDTVHTVRLRADHYRDGKFGRGYYFEKTSHNMLPPAVANVEKDSADFRALGHSELALVNADTEFGRKALRISVMGPEDGFQTAPLQVRCRGLSWHEKKWMLLASAYVKGQEGCTVTADVRFVSKDLELPKSKGKNSEEPAERIPDSNEPREIVLTGDWQRVACTAVSDGRLREREAIFSLRVKDDSPERAVLLADGFQFEQAGYYPHHHSMPTTWLEGGRSESATSLNIGSPLREMFPVEEGSIAFWTRTPRESNLRGQGSITWMSFGAGWAPKWNMSTYRFSAGGEGFCYFKNTNVADGQWHHVAMTWDRTKGYAYLDGKQVASFVHKEDESAKELETYVLRLGGSVSDGQAANSVMDDVAIFKRNLTDAEIETLATGQGPLRATTAPFAFAPSVRTVFYRDEETASLKIPASGDVRTNLKCSVDVAIGECVSTRTNLNIRKGKGELNMEFSPSKLKCGDYLCRVAAWPSDEQPVYSEFHISIVPAIRRDLFLLSSWGGGGATTEWRTFCKTLGLNAIDGSGNIQQLGREGFRYGWHYRFGNGIWSPENRETVREKTRNGAANLARFPNWTHALLNTETWPGKIPDDEERKAWFDDWAREELGFPIPEKGWKFGTSHNPIQCWFPEGEKPGENGVFEEPPNTFRFLYWWYNRGCGWWRLNAEAAGEINAARPDVKCWTDPLRYPGQVADLDAGGTWSYEIRPEPLIGAFESAYANVRGTDKEFYATLGMNYVSGLTNKVEVPGLEGVKNIAPTGDDLIQQAWFAITRIPSDGLFYWDLRGVFYGRNGEQNRYAEPDADERLGNVLKNDLLPYGTMLKGTPPASRTLALLLPESTQWMCAGEGGWGWGTAHFPRAWKSWIGAMGIPYDVLLDHNITPGALAKYQAVVFPMAQFVSKKVHEELMAAGKAGTEIVVDSYCRQEYPDMVRVDQEYYYKMRDKKEYEAQTKKTVEFLAELKQRLAPHMQAYATGADGPVFTSIREAGDVTYVSVVNDLRQPGPYTEWTGNDGFQPYGKAQTATVSIRAPKDSVMYEFTQSRRLTPVVDGDRLLVTVNLPPHAGRVIAVYPAAMKTIRIEPKRSYRTGESGVIPVTIDDARDARVAGRQLVRVTIRDPENRVHDESGIYRVVDGEVDIPFRPALNESAGDWTIDVVERTSGLTAEGVLNVK